MKHLFVVLVTLVLGTSAAMACQGEAMKNAGADTVPQQTIPESAT